MNGFLASISSWIGDWFVKSNWIRASGGPQTVSHENVCEYTALNQSTVWCATRLLCGTGASLPLPIYRGRDSENRTKDRSHRVYKLLNGSPNTEMTSYAFRSVMWQWQVNWGNAYAEIVREGNDPDGPIVALWPIHPERVQPSRDSSGELYYRVHNELTREWSDVDAWRILHVPSIITYDGIYGHGVIAHARETIGAGIAAEKYGANFFGAGAMPRLVIKHAGKWDPEIRTSFRREWEEIHSGAAGSRVALLGGGAEVQPLSFSSQDSQFMEFRQFTIDEVARWYGIPPILLQHFVNASMANSEELGISFVQHCLLLWLRAWEQSIWQRLFTPSEQETYFAEHNVDALLRGNAVARAGFYQSMTAASIMTRNECRKLENLDPVEGGDTFLVQGAMVPLDEDGKPESKFVAGNDPSTTQMPSDPSSGSDSNSSPDDSATGVITQVKGHLNRIINHDLSRFLTKETKAMANCAKKPDVFVQLVDKFYIDHTTIVRDEMTETFGALNACGLNINVEQFVTTWIDEGKSIILDASGSAKPDELLTRIQGTIESRTWTERPLRAAERANHAIAIV